MQWSDWSGDKKEHISKNVYHNFIMYIFTLKYLWNIINIIKKWAVGPASGYLLPSATDLIGWALVWSEWPLEFVGTYLLENALFGNKVLI